MKVAVINYSGNVGKTTICKHILLPRMPGAELISIESINAAEGSGPSLRGNQYTVLQEYLETVDSAVIDVGASNAEDLLDLMQMYRESQEDIDYFVVPTVPLLKQQQDTIATLVDLSRLGIGPTRLRVVFNMVERGTPIEQSFYFLLDFLAEQPIAVVDVACRLRANEIYARLRRSQTDLATWLADTTDYKRLIARTTDVTQKVELARKLATRRLARGVVDEMAACFAALHLDDRPGEADNPLPNST